MQIRRANSARTFFDHCSTAAKKGAYITVARPPVFVNNFEQPRVKPTSFKADSHEMFVLEMIASIDTQVQNERTNTLNRQEGRKGGRPPALSEEKVARMKQMFKDGATQQQISAEFRISQATVSRYFNEIILGKGRAPPPRIGRIRVSFARREESTNASVVNALRNSKQSRLVKANLKCYV